MEDYNRINNLKLVDGRYLFVDMFCRNNELILIIPNYITIDELSKLDIYNNTDKLCIKKKYIHGLNVTAVTHIAIYDINPVEKEKIKIKIAFNDITNEYTISHINLCKKYKLCLSTLFKDDYFLLNKFISYYKNQGVEHFYLYYNDDISKLPSKYIENENTTFIEWNYPYFVGSTPSGAPRGLAQGAQLCHSLYKYGIPETDFMIYNDLDEYFYIEKNTISNVINQTKDVDTFMFLNVWADTIDIPTDARYFKDLEMDTDLPRTFYIDKNIGQPGIRSKCIHKTSSIYNICNIHSGEYYNDPKNIVSCTDASMNKLTMFHFFRWSPEKSRERALLRGRRDSGTRQRTDTDINFNDYKIFKNSPQLN